MTSEQLKDLIEDLRLNHEFCPKEVILQSADELERIMGDRQLIEDLLSALEYHTEQTRPIEFSRVAIEAAREYLRKPAQRTWVGLTEEERASFWTADQMTQKEWDELFNAIEAKLKEKNT